MKKQLLFGTNNSHKLREIREILSDHYEIVSLADLGIEMEVEETEDTLIGNAFLKARAYHKVSGLPTFSDDTGLEVDALGGAPGVYSARYAGEGCSFADNVAKMLREMTGQAQRSARFRTVIAFVDGEQDLTFEGKIEGSITEEIYGEGGFGYDPIFLPEHQSKTFAEMSPDEKNAISHRGRAIQSFTQFLLP